VILSGCHARAPHAHSKADWRKTQGTERLLWEAAWGKKCCHLTLSRCRTNVADDLWFFVVQLHACDIKRNRSFRDRNSSEAEVRDSWYVAVCIAICQVKSEWWNILITYGSGCQGWCQGLGVGVLNYWCIKGYDKIWGQTKPLHNTARLMDLVWVKICAMATDNMVALSPHVSLHCPIGEDEVLSKVLTKAIEGKDA